jgi:hypothetical protein
MAGGRKLGSKNQQGHNAGGRRSGAGRPRKGDEGSNKRIRTAPSDAEKREQEEKRKQELEREKVEREEAMRINRELYIEQLRDVAYQHANEATADVEDEDEEDEDLDDYMTYDDDNETQNDEGNKDDNDESNEDAHETQNDEAPDNGKSRKQRNCFVIEKDSPISKEMNRIVNKVDKAEKQVSDMYKKFWHHAASDPVLCSTQASPDYFYRARFSCFVWIPTKQFKDVVDLKSIRCPRCNIHGNLNLNKKSFRPMFKNAEQIWVLHHELQCRKSKKEGCGKYSSTIDPTFMAQLPTRCVKSFPFIVPLRGPGVHIDMVREYLFLCSKQISIGNYVQMINKMIRTKYFETVDMYYDIQVEKKKRFF